MSINLQNTKGQVFYGLHFYPGVAEYQAPGGDPYRVFLNEDTLRQMDSTFAGRPVYVHHVDGVEQNLDELRGEVDGWVTKSFYNSADGKHRVEFIVVSEKGLKAVKNGMRLSNCYMPKTFGQGGFWNGVAYTKEIKDAEYEHLAIVPNPRYQESVILEPEQFKKYNADKILELSRVANAIDNKGKGEKSMLQFFKRAKVENSIDLAEMCVVLPKTGREVSIEKLVNEMDMFEEKKKDNMADGMGQVDVRGEKMTVNDLVEKHMKMCDDMAAMLAPKKDAEDGDDMDQASGDTPSDLSNDEDEDKKALQLKAEKEKEVESKKDDDKKKNDLALAKAKALRLSNANMVNSEEVAPTIELSMDKVARGKSRYGSSK